MPIRRTSYARSIVRGLATLLATGIAAAPAHADPDVDIQGWGGIIASGPIRGDLFVWIEGQARALDDLGGGSQLMARSAIGARIGRDAHAVAGYAYVRTDPASGPVTHEHRLWQQVQFVPLRRGDGAPLIVSRTRLEQRMFEGRSDTGWRLRQMVRAQVPVSSSSKVLAVVHTEGFLNLNATDAGARTGVDQWRTFVGVGIPLNKRLRLEPGYLNQYVFRRGDDRMNHVLSATLFIAL